MEPYKDLQQVFDIVAPHLLKQGKQSATTIGLITQCRYRGPKGMKCAVGALLPDNVLESDEDNNKAFSELYADKYQVRYLFKNVSVAHISCLQTIHDVVPPQNWRKRLEYFAEARGLNTECMNVHSMA